MTLQLVMPQNSGGQSPFLPNTTRGSVICAPSSGNHHRHAAAVASTPSAAACMATKDDLLRLENCWLDLTSCIAATEMGQTEKTDPASTTCPLLSDIVMELDLDDSAAEMSMMNANMKILENFILDGNNVTAEDNSLDSFGSDLETNQSLIDEVESYLMAATGGLPTIVALDEEEEKTAGDVTTPSAVHPMDDEEEKNSNILKALASGKVWTTDEESSSSRSRNDLGLNLTEEDLANAYTTTIKTESGQEVIIIIAQPAGGMSPPVSPPEYVLPSLGSISPAYSSSDCDWSPSPGQQQQQRKKYQRKNRPTLAMAPYPRDKTERKKAQNRTAAFRYREKKKAELDAVDTEVEQLTAKNTALKARLRDMEQEYRCLKRLMVETGLSHLLLEAV